MKRHTKRFITAQQDCCVACFNKIKNMLSASAGLPACLPENVGKWVRMELREEGKGKQEKEPDWISNERADIKDREWSRRAWVPYFKKKLSSV